MVPAHLELQNVPHYYLRKKKSASWSIFCTQNEQARTLETVSDSISCIKQHLKNSKRILHLAQMQWKTHFCFSIPRHAYIDKRMKMKELKEWFDMKDSARNQKWTKSCISYPSVKSHGVSTSLCTSKHSSSWISQIPQLYQLPFVLFHTEKRNCQEVTSHSRKLRILWAVVFPPQQHAKFICPWHDGLF